MKVGKKCEYLEAVEGGCSFQCIFSIGGTRTKSPAREIRFAFHSSWFWRKSTLGIIVAAAAAAAAALRTQS